MALLKIEQYLSWYLLYPRRKRCHWNCY